MNTNDWRSNPKWQNNMIPANGGGKKNRNSAWLFFVILLGFVGFILYEEKDELLAHFYAGEYSEMQTLIVLLFPLIFLFTQVKKNIRRGRKLSALFVMNPFPATLDGKFSGYIELNKKSDTSVFTAELQLTKSVQGYIENEIENEVGVEVQKQAVLRRQVVWSMPLSVTSENAMLGTRLLIDGRLNTATMSAGMPTLTVPVSDDLHVWQLAVSSQDKRYRGTWDVPIVTE